MDVLDTELGDLDDYYTVNLPESQWTSIDKWFGDNVSLTSLVMTEQNKIKKTIEKGRRKNIRTGIPTVDVMLNGLFPGEVLYIGNTEENCSNAFGFNIVKNFAIEKNKKLQIFNCGRGEYSYARGILSLCSGIDEFELLIGENLSEDELDIIEECVEKIQKSNISINSSPNIAVEDICDNITMLEPKEYPELILVDNLCFVTTKKKSKNKSQEYRIVSQKLWKLAKDTKIPIVILGPLSKQRSKMKNYYPTAKDMPAENMLESFDKILMVHRDANEKNKEIIKVTSVKNPDGKYGFRMLQCNKYCYGLNELNMGVKRNKKYP